MKKVLIPLVCILHCMCLWLAILANSRVHGRGLLGATCGEILSISDKDFEETILRIIRADSCPDYELPCEWEQLQQRYNASYEKLKEIDLCRSIVPLIANDIIKQTDEDFLTWKVEVAMHHKRNTQEDSAAIISHIDRFLYDPETVEKIEILRAKR